MANITVNLNFLSVLSLEAVTGNLDPSAITWSSFSVVMVSIPSYEIDRGGFVPIFTVKVHES